MNSPHLLVIGGIGFIGHHLLKAAQLKDWKITSVSLNHPTEFRFVDAVEYLHFDLNKHALVKKYLNENFDYVVNLGGYINHQLFKDGGRKLIDTHFTTTRRTDLKGSLRGLGPLSHLTTPAASVLRYLGHVISNGPREPS